jgi:hypothetical protein
MFGGNNNSSSNSFSFGGGNTNSNSGTSLFGGNSSSSNKSDFLYFSILTKKLACSEIVAIILVVLRFLGPITKAAAVEDYLETTVKPTTPVHHYLATREAALEIIIQETRMERLRSLR